MSALALKVGCAANKIEVPLFAELYGYGPFLGRRNRGVYQDIFCRAASFTQGHSTVLIIVSDLVTMDDKQAWVVRNEISVQSGIKPENIMLCATHTHSAPTISPGIGWGELSPEFLSNWKNCAVKTGLSALSSTEKVSMHNGKAPLNKQLGKNRVFEEGPTDPDIRWTKFLRDNGSCKLLLHNHGMHGVVFGQQMFYVSPDWPGAANEVILQRKLADNVLFLQGAYEMLCKHFSNVGMNCAVT